MARTVACINCRHFQKINYPYYVSYCGHEFAAKMDRVRGPIQPRLDILVDDETLKITTDRCDKEGWFEPVRPWWQFWS